MFKKNQQIVMPAEYWTLLERYQEALNIRLRRDDLPSVNRGQIIGAILTRFLLAHFSEIMDTHAELTLQNYMGWASKALGVELATTAFGSDIPEIPNGAGTGRYRPRSRGANTPIKRPLLGPTGR